MKRFFGFISILTIASLSSAFPLACAFACQSPVTIKAKTSHCHGNSAAETKPIFSPGWQSASTNCALLAAFEKNKELAPLPKPELSIKDFSWLVGSVNFGLPQSRFEFQKKLAFSRSPTPLPSLPLYLKNSVLRI